MLLDCSAPSQYWVRTWLWEEIKLRDVATYLPLISVPKFAKGWLADVQILVHAHASSCTGEGDTIIIIIDVLIKDHLIYGKHLHNKILKERELYALHATHLPARLPNNHRRFDIR